VTGRIRLVVSDIDGTILDADKAVRPETAAAAARLKAAGIPLALVSSRPPRGIDSVRDALGLTGPVAAFNGGFISGGAGKAPIAEHLIPEQAAHQTLEFLTRRGIDAWLFADDEWLLKDPHTKYVPKEKRAIGFGPTVVADFTPYLARCGKIVGVSEDFALLGKSEAALNAALGAAAAAHRSQKFYLDVTHTTANKGDALRAIAAWYGFDPAEAAAIGDMANDIPMLRTAGLSIAMGNASPDVAAAAKVQTGPNTGSGWADAIDRYVLKTAA
jgi:hypothetical protein